MERNFLHFYIQMKLLSSVEKKKKYNSGEFLEGSYLKWNLSHRVEKSKETSKGHIKKQTKEDISLHYV